MTKIWLAAAVATFAAGAAVAQDDATLMDYAEVDGWSIAIDPSLNNGCLMMSEFEDNSVVRIGFDMTTGNGYVLSANPGWGSIEEGKSYPITITLDEQGFDGEATGMIIDDLPGADVLVANPDFFGALVEAKSMSLAHDGNEVMSLDIEGSANAVMKVIECQDAQIAAQAG